MDEVLEKRDFKNPERRRPFSGPHWQKVSSIMSFDLKSRMRRSGSMFETILCVLD
jgi:hypothetical protein